MCPLTVSVLFSLLCAEVYIIRKEYFKMLAQTGDYMLDILPHDVVCCATIVPQDDYSVLNLALTGYVTDLAFKLLVIVQGHKKVKFTQKRKLKLTVINVIPITAFMLSTLP